MVLDLVPEVLDDLELPTLIVPRPLLGHFSTSLELGFHQSHRSGCQLSGLGNLALDLLIAFRGEHVQLLNLRGGTAWKRHPYHIRFLLLDEVHNLVEAASLVEVTSIEQSASNASSSTKLNSSGDATVLFAAKLQNCGRSSFTVRGRQGHHELTPSTTSQDKAEVDEVGECTQQWTCSEKRAGGT